MAFFINMKIAGRMMIIKKFLPFIDEQWEEKRRNPLISIDHHHMIVMFMQFKQSKKDPKYKDMRRRNYFLFEIFSVISLLFVTDSDEVMDI